MARHQLDIDTASIFDNSDERQVEFEGEVEGDDYQFAVQYDVLEALSGAAPEEDEGVDIFNAFIDVIKDAALSALARDTDASIIMVSENDLDQ